MDTATTENYTYRHSRSLHDALPISAQLTLRRFASLWPRGQTMTKRSTISGWKLKSRCAAGVTVRPKSAAPLSTRSWIRSEEHTSELQSLMRISYAVLCLKKKTYSTESPLQEETQAVNIYTK